MLECLAKDSTLIYEYTDLDQTIFHICCKRNLADLLYLACRGRKGDLDARDMTGKTAVMWAYEFNHIRCLRVMLAAGAKPFIYEKAVGKDFFMNPIIKYLKDKAITVPFNNSVTCWAIVQISTRKERCLKINESLRENFHQV